MYKIGIDLSTTNTGIVVLDDENKLILQKIISFRTFSELNHRYNFALIDSACIELSNYLICGKCEIGIELANFRKALLTNRFSLYAGAFINNIIKYDNVGIKCFNANQWHQFIGVKIGYDTREITKKKAREFAKNHCKEYSEDWSEDICDAYCIAFLLPYIKSNEQKTKEVKNRKSEYVKKVQQKAKINKMIENRLNQIQELDYKKNKKKIERLQQEIKELKECSK